MSKSVSLHTLGCKLNYSETSTISGLFHLNGFKINEFGENSDIFVLNTCTVTENADKECRQIIRSVLNKNPDTYVIVTGCYAQLKPHEIAALKGVDLILGTNEKFKLFDYIDNFEKKSYSCIFTSPLNEITDFDYAYSSDIDSRTRAFLKIQDGCDYNCSFCTIPLARGASRSLALQMLIENAKKLIGSGYKEIVLTGVNTGDYHYLSTNNGTTGKIFGLIDVLYELDKLDIPRIRISSIEPNLLTDDIIQLVKSSDKFCKHFHIPLQSGDNEVLKKMRRRYNRDLFEKLIYKLNEEMPGIGIGVDVIVGFPTESEIQFRQTLDLLSEIKFDTVHVAAYSPRTGTTAARKYEDGIPLREKKERLNKVELLQESIQTEINARLLGGTVEILVEGRNKGKWYGRTRTDKLVFFNSGREYLGQLVKIRIGKTSPWSLQGKIETENINQEEK